MMYKISNVKCEPVAASGPGFISPGSDWGKIGYMGGGGVEGGIFTGFGVSSSDQCVFPLVMNELVIRFDAHVGLIASLLASALKIYNFAD